MISKIDDLFDSTGKFLLKLVYPHEHNNHRPWVITNRGLLVFLILIVSMQAITNFSTKSGAVLGFATNITVSDIISLTNQQRSALGLSTLSTNTSLNQAAALKAQDMFEDDYWDHYAPDGTSPWYFFGLVGYKYTWAGENLARDFATSGGVVDAWMASPGHKANIVNNNFKEIGVAVVNGNLAGEDTTLVVQLFGTSSQTVTAPAASQTPSTPSPDTAGASKVEADIKVPSNADTTEQTNTKLPTAANSSEKGVEALKQAPKSLSEVPPVSLVKNSTASQKVTMSLLALILFLMVFDSVIIFRKRHIRVGSHSLAHASMILILLIITIMYGYGKVI